MFKFLHVSDVHLGYRQYKLKEREQDFYLAFRDACTHYAIEREVDFVLLGGDLFHQRHISPQTYNQASYVFRQLQKADIPVIAIEGNHDFRDNTQHSSNQGSWYEALAQSGLLYFLYPQTNKDGDLIFNPLSLGGRFLGGGYIDLPIKGQLVRIVGCPWYGFHAGDKLQEYAQHIELLQQEKRADFCIFAFHGGHEDYLPVGRGGVAGSDFQALADVVDYVALGHIHQYYIKTDKAGKNFLFNPGSTEANSIAEAKIERGVLYVEVSPGKKVDYELCKDYYQRPFIDLRQPGSHQSLEELISNTCQQIQAQIQRKPHLKPVVQVRLKDKLNFKVEEVSTLEKKIKELEVLHCQISTEQTEESPPFPVLRLNTSHQESDAHEHHDKLEEQILTEILTNNFSQDNADNLLKSMLSIKDYINQEREISEIIDLLPRTIPVDNSSDKLA